MKGMKIQEKKKEAGITLVALVVTIIILIILAGITLSLVLGQNGIIGKSKEAKDASANADKATSEGLNDLDHETYDAIKGIASQVGEYRDNQKVVSESSNIAIKDDEGNIVTIPAGFKIASDSATKQEDGIVIEDKDGNQFVWIPVTNIAKYARTYFKASRDWGGDPSFSSYLETMPSDEQTSVNTYHGYYIGRYEAGDITSTANKVMRAEGANSTNAVSIKEGQAPYNWVTEDQASTLAIEIKIAEGYNATTKLCSSYAWDTAMNFIQNKVLNYAITSPQGNYVDATFSYIDITGISKTKSSGPDEYELIPTGETTPVCNIYDMGGNDFEWTTEGCMGYGGSCVGRGGSFSRSYSYYPAGSRLNNTSSFSYCDTCFRVTLYM